MKYTLYKFNIKIKLKNIVKSEIFENCSVSKNYMTKKIKLGETLKFWTLPKFWKASKKLFLTHF